MGRAIINDLLTERIIGCCFKVHGEIGPGFPEKIYQKALCKALVNAGLNFQQEKYFNVGFDGVKVGVFKVDLFIDEKVIVELKAVNGVMPKSFSSQLLSYLKASSVKVGLLINFGNDSCEIKRYVY